MSDPEGAGGERLSVRDTARDAVALYARHWKLLAPLAMLVLLPQAVIGTYLGELEIERVETVGDVVTLIAAPVTVLISLGGEALLAGVITALVLDWRAGQSPPDIPTFLRSLAWLTLIAMDALIAFGAALGLLLLVLPGLTFLTYFAIGPPVVEIERRGLWDALRRSAALVHGRFWEVFALIVGALLVTEGLAELLARLLHGFAPEIASELVVDALLESIQGVIVALTAISLIALERPRKTSGPPP